jgi:predicted tellurium resistance membrane protein TerC
MLIFLEIILSIDNLIFLSSLVSKLNDKQAKIARLIGLSFAFFFRLILIFSINYFLDLEKEVFLIFNFSINLKKLIFFFGGIFLIYKTIPEIYEILFPKEKIINNNNENSEKNFISSFFKKNIVSIIGDKYKFYIAFFLIVLEIILIDFIFSIDSILVAIALAPNMKILIIAMFVSSLTLFFLINYLTKILIRFPSMKLLCMFFIIFIGLLFILESFDINISRSYIGVAFGFGIIFETFDIIRIHNLEKKSIKRIE